MVQYESLFSQEQLWRGELAVPRCKYPYVAGTNRVHVSGRSVIDNKDRHRVSLQTCGRTIDSWRGEQAANQILPKQS